MVKGPKGLLNTKTNWQSDCQLQNQLQLQLHSSVEDEVQFKFGH
jgi:hypothetical protein